MNWTCYGQLKYMFLFVLAAACIVQADIDVARSGEARVVIVLAPDASEKQKSATADLKKYLEKITGATLDIIGVNDATAGLFPEMSRIFVGDSSVARQLAPKVEWDRLAADEIVIKSVDGHLIVAGGKPRGTVYAIYTLLQDMIGCRWWAPDAMFIPSDPSLSLPELDIRYAPPFEVRVILGEIAMLPEARSWHRLSFDLSFDTSPRGIPSRILKAEKYYIKHPEWFAYLRDEGSEDEEYTYRYVLKTWKHNALHEPKPNPYDAYVEVLERTRRVYAQPCPHSEGARKTILEALLAEIAAGQGTWNSPQVVWVNQGHGYYMCQCERCEAVRDKEGADSGNWVLMANAIAQEVEKVYPDVFVGVSAYWHTEAPPAAVQPRKNVLVYQALYTQNRLDPSRTYAFQSHALKKWASIAKLYVWDFDSNNRNYYQPHPNYFVRGDNMQFFNEIGVDGIMVQGGFGKAADLLALRTWVTAQMLWNPNQNPRKLMIEFLDGYYGAAAPILMEYMEAMVDGAHRNKDQWLGSYEFTTAGWATVRDMNTATRLFDEAAAAVKGDKILSQRVWLARQSIDLSWLDRYDEFKQEAADKGIPFLGPPNPSKIIDAVAPYRQTWGRWHIGKPFSAYFDEMKEKFSSTTGN